MAWKFAIPVVGALFVSTAFAAEKTGAARLDFVQFSPTQMPPTSTDRQDMNFSGDWKINASMNSSIILTLIQDGDNVTGQYVTQNGDRGRINGRVQGSVMIFAWSQDSGVKGAGRFDLASDGSSFSIVCRAASFHS